MEETVANQAVEINKKAEEILTLKQENADLNDQLQRRDGLPVLKLNPEASDKEAVLLALTGKDRQTLAEEFQRADSDRKCIGIIAVVAVVVFILALILSAIIGNSYYESYSHGQYVGNDDQCARWLMQLDVLRPLENKVRDISTKLDHYKIRRKECDRNFQNLLSKIKGRQNQVKVIQKNIAAEKINFKLDKVQWLIKYSSLLYDFQSTISKHKRAQYDLILDLSDFEQIKNTLHDDYRLLLDLYSDVRTKLNNQYAKLVSSNTDLDQFDFTLSKIVIKKLDENLETFHPKFDNLHMALSYGDVLKYDVVKAGTEYAKVLHQHMQRNQKEIQKVYSSHSSHFEKNACFPKSSRLHDYVFMLHGWGNNYGCRFKESEPDIYIYHWNNYYYDDRIYASTYTPGLMSSLSG